MIIMYYPLFSAVPLVLAFMLLYVQEYLFHEVVYYISVVSTSWTYSSKLVYCASLPFGLHSFKYFTADRRMQPIDLGLNLFRHPMPIFYDAFMVNMQYSLP